MTEEVMEGISSLDTRNKESLLTALNVLGLDDALNELKAIIIVAKSELQLTQINLNSLAICSITGGSVPENIRKKLPQERFTDEGKIVQRYTYFFSPMSELGWYDALITNFSSYTEE